MHRHPLILCLAAGLASATGFAPLGTWPITIACCALLMHLVRSAPGLKSALLRGWVFAVGHFTVGLNWIAHAFTFQDAMPHWFGYGAVIMLALYLAVYPAIAAGLAWRRAKSSVVFTLFFAAGWIVTEWLRATMFTGFAWNPLGVIWVGTPVASVSPWIGTYGLSGLTLLLAGAMIEAVARRPGEAARLALLPGLALVSGLLPVVQDDRPGPVIRIVQPNIGQQTKYDDAFDAENFRKLVLLSGKPGPEPRLLLWPEAAVPEYLDEDAEARARMAALLGPRDILLTGGTKRYRKREKKGEYIEEYTIGGRNSLFAMDARGRLLHRYDKAHLVPYGEYLPMRPILSAIGLSRLVPGDIDFWAGPGPQSYKLPGFGTVGVQICYEIIFSGEVIDRANRPDFLFNPSNDAWFGSWGPPQHLAQARLRAIEEGLPVIRSTPTGISAIVTAKGVVTHSLPHETAGYIAGRLPPPLAPTPFARLGNILPFLFALLLIGLGVAMRRRAR